MFDISDATIKHLASNSLVFAKGLKYYHENRVVKMEINEHDLCISAVVLGSDRYEVEVCFAPNGELIHMYCDCPAFYQYEGGCKHIVAVLKAGQRGSSVTVGSKKTKTGTNAKKIGQSDPRAESILNYFEYNLHDQTRIPVYTEATVEISLQRVDGRMEAVPALSLRMGENKSYVVKSIKKLFEALDNGTSVVFGKNFTFDPARHFFKPEDKPLIDFLRSIYEVEKTIHDNMWWYVNRKINHGSVFSGKTIILTQATAKKLLDLLPSEKFNLKLPDSEYKNIQVLEQDLPLQFLLDKSGAQLELQLRAAGYLPLIKTGEYVFFNGEIYKVSKLQAKYFAPLADAFAQSARGIRLTAQQGERFVTQVLPTLKKIGQVQISPAVQDSFFQTELKTEIYLDRKDEAVTARVDFEYGPIKINPFANDNDRLTGDRILIRDLDSEGAILNLLERAEFRTVNGSLYLKDEEMIYEFVYHVLPELQDLADVYYSERFRNMRVRDKAAFSGGVRLNEESDMLDFSFQLDDIDMNEIGNIFQSLREKKKYYRLRDGSFLPLDTEDNQLYQLANMLDSLNISGRDLQKKVLSIPKSRAIYIDRCLRESNMQVERNQAFKQLVQSISEPQDMDFVLPGGINGVPREYQRTGFKWLKTLAMYGLGGILADDMGLGKTFQAIAFVLSERERVQAPSMVVAPTSVVYNWQDEVGKFAPGLKVVVVSGSLKERENLLAEAKNADLVVTSYALLRRDVELYADFNFGYCFLDEAQHIKNPNSINAKSVKTIKARSRFALTGTPIENGLTELWSIFDFVMPGYLLNHQKFVKKYERPVVKNQDEKALRILQKQIAPFILRRMKTEVLQELPPKIESKVLADLTTEQKKIYVSYLHQARQEVNTVLANGGFEKSQIKILALLTRLRQICCHPATFLDNYDGDSGKLIYLKEFLKDAVNSGHRVLLFSQFVAMLAIIRKLMDGEQINYFYLDGSSKAEERGQMVRAFNRGKGDAFLISLKAGGTGLNLTGADMVIHYDPWWNPAVEEQATDRAYRIGQKNSVQVISLITRGTIEEKIYALQQKKKAMIESVIKPGETMLAKMTEQEVRELFDM
ncbi:DEAD/DEAH box helicase [Desulfoscipio gibsoniae]